MAKKSPTTASMSVFGIRTKERLKALEKDQTWLAEKLELSDEAVSKWCRAGGNPTVDNLLRTARLLKCQAGYLVGDIEDKTAAEAVRMIMEIDEDSRHEVIKGLAVVCAMLPKASERKAA